MQITATALPERRLVLPLEIDSRCGWAGKLAACCMSACFLAYPNRRTVTHWTADRELVGEDQCLTRSRTRQQHQSSLPGFPCGPRWSDTWAATWSAIWTAIAELESEFASLTEWTPCFQRCVLSYPNFHSWRSFFDRVWCVRDAYDHERLCWWESIVVTAVLLQRFDVELSLLFGVLLNDLSRNSNHQATNSRAPSWQNHAI